MRVPPHTNLFTQVDRTNDPDFFVRFMDEAQKPAGIQASKRLMRDRLALAPGAALLDVGCGPGTDLFDLVAQVGSSGRLVGLDASDVMITETTRTIVLSYSDAMRNGWIGRQLPRLFKEQHLTVDSIDPAQVFVHFALAELFLGSHLTVLQINGTLMGDQARAWWEYLQRAEAQGTLLISFTAFIVVGTKH